MLTKKDNGFEFRKVHISSEDQKLVKPEVFETTEQFQLATENSDKPGPAQVGAISKAQK